MAHLDQDALAALVADGESKVTVGATYVHYKHSDMRYKVLSIALIEATDEPAVVYEAQYGAKVIFVRPVNDWLETVEWQGKTVPRFTKII
jgi:hypothetical protein